MHINLAASVPMRFLQSLLATLEEEGFLWISILFDYILADKIWNQFHGRLTKPFMGYRYAMSMHWRK